MKKTTMTTNQFPVGCDEQKIKDVINYYETQTEEEALAEYQSPWNDPNYTLIQVPNELVDAVEELINLYQQQKQKIISN